MEFGNNNGYNQNGNGYQHSYQQPVNVNKEQPTPNYQPMPNNLQAKQPVSGWSWGAFMFNWVWGLGNRCYLTLLMFVPILNFIWMFVCGACGHQWAMHSGTYRTVEEFNAAMESWNRAGKIMFFIWLAIMLLYLIIVIGTFAIVGASFGELFSNL